MVSKDIETHEATIRLRPNEGVWTSVRNAGLFSLIAGVSMGLSVGFHMSIVQGSVAGVALGIALGGGVALFAALFLGLEPYLKHFWLRAMLSRSGTLPFNLVPFLDYAAERIFLRKVGGSYIFAHRMLLEYFANLTPDQQRALVEHLPNTKG